MENEGRKRVVKVAKRLNIVVVILVLCLSSLYRFVGNNPESLNTSMLISLVIMALAISILVFTIVLQVKIKKIPGLIMLSIAAGLVAIFSFFGFTLGLAIYLLCGFSYKLLSDYSKSLVI